MDQELCNEMRALRDELEAFLAARAGTIRKIPGFCEAAHAEMASLDASKPEEHCRLRELGYLRRALSRLPEVAGSTVGSKRKVKMLNALRMVEAD